MNVAAGTDFGGGDEWLIPRVLGDAFKVHINGDGGAGVSLHPPAMLFMGTPALEANTNRAVRSADPDLARDQTLFALSMGIRELSISEVYVQGRRVTTG